MPAKKVNIKSITRFRKSLANLSILTDIAKDMEKHNVPKLDRKLEFLYRSYIVHLIVLWQSFIKSLAREAYEAHIKVGRASVFKNELSKFVYKPRLDRFNTPDTQNIDNLYSVAAGITKMSDHWHWDNISVPMARHQLDELLRLQNVIAHTGYGRSSMTYKGNFDYADFLLKIAEIMSEVVANNLLGSTGNPSNGIVANMSE